MVVGHNLSKSLYCRYHLELLLHRYGNINGKDEHCLLTKRKKDKYTGKELLKFTKIDNN